MKGGAPTRLASTSEDDEVLHGVVECNRYVPQIFTAQIASTTLEVTQLINACAHGMLDAIQTEVNRIQGCSHGLANFDEEIAQTPLEIELSTTDNWVKWTPLHWAAYCDAGDAIQYLVSVGADVSVKSFVARSTALHTASRYGSASAVKALLELGASVSVVNKIGNMPLHECCIDIFAVLRQPTAPLEVAQMLLVARAPVNAHNRPISNSMKMLPLVHGLTPLQVSAVAGNVEMIRVLLAWGADPRLTRLELSIDPSFSRNDAAMSPSTPADDGGGHCAPPMLEKMNGSVDSMTHDCTSIEFSESCRPPQAKRTDSPFFTRMRLGVGNNNDNTANLKFNQHSRIKEDFTPPSSTDTAVQLALRRKNLLALAEILLGMWRHHPGDVGAVEVERLKPEEVFKMVTTVWVSNELLRRDLRSTVRALTIILLSLKQDHRVRGVSKPMPNPVCDALGISSSCRRKADQNARAGRWPVATSLRQLALLFEIVALGLLDGSHLSTDEAKTRYSRWCARSSFEHSEQDAATVEPNLSHDVWLRESCAYAASGSQSYSLFFSDKQVFAHVRETFFPKKVLIHNNWAWKLCDIAHNMAWLPLLVVSPSAAVNERIKSQNFLRSKRKAPVIWLYPGGIAMLRFTSSLVLALLVTARPAIQDMQWHPVDFFTLWWTVAIAESVLEEMYYQRLVFWIAEVFNQLELLLIILMAGLHACRFGNMYWLGSTAYSDAGVLRSLHSFACLLTWLRLLRACYYFPSAGPQLLTILHLMRDLGALLPLMTFLLFAFACSSCVLFFDTSVSGESFAMLFVNMMRQLVGLTLNAEPQNIEIVWPGPEYATNTAVQFSAFLLMLTFGLIVVVLLLSMIVAKFSQRVEYVTRSTDRVYKLKFAQVTFSCLGQLRTAELVPQPLNSIRRLCLVINWLIHRRRARTDVQPARAAKATRSTIDFGSRHDAPRMSAAFTGPTGVFRHESCSSDARRRPGKADRPKVKGRLSVSFDMPRVIGRRSSRSNSQSQVQSRSYWPSRRTFSSNVASRRGSLPRTPRAARMALRYLQQKHIWSTSNITLQAHKKADKLGLRLPNVVERFIEASIAEVKLFPESVESYFEDHKHLLDIECE